MADSSRTPIEQTDFPDETKRLLKENWIDTLEEAIAYVAALPADSDALRKSGLDCISSIDHAPNISSDKLTALRTPRSRYSLGCRINERSMERLRLSGSLRESAPPPAGIFKAEIPKSVRLIDKMQPIRDQAERGTCVASWVSLE